MQTVTTSSGHSHITLDARDEETCKILRERDTDEFIEEEVFYDRVNKKLNTHV